MPSKSNFYLSHSENSSFNRSTLDRTFLCGRFADRILVAEHANLLHLFGGRHKIFTTLRVIGELLVLMARLGEELLERHVAFGEAFLSGTREALPMVISAFLRILLLGAPETLGFGGKECFGQTGSKNNSTFRRSKGK